MDDNPTCRTYLHRAVRAAGFSNIEVSGLPSVALETCRTKRPEIVLADFQMTEMSGLTFIRRLGAMPETRRIACALVSARPVQELKQDAYAAGALDVLTKPVTASELRVKLRQLSAEAAHRRSDSWVAVRQPDWQGLQVRVLGLGDRRKAQRVAAYASVIGRRLKLAAGDSASLPAEVAAPGQSQGISCAMSCTPYRDAALSAGHWRFADRLPQVAAAAQILRIAEDFECMTALADDEAVWNVLRAKEAIRSRLRNRYQSSVIDAFNCVLPQLVALQSRYRDATTATTTTDAPHTLSAVRNTTDVWA